VKQAFKQQLELAGIDEKRFVVDRLLAHQDSLSTLISCIAKRVRDGSISDADVKILTTALQQQADSIDTAADLLNYKSEEVAKTNDMPLLGGFNYTAPRQLTEATVTNVETNNVKTEDEA